MAVSGLCILLIVPIVSGKATIILTPVTFFTVAGMLIKPMMQTFEAASEINAKADSIDSPDWVNKCLDPSAQVNFTGMTNQKETLESVALEMNQLAIVCLVYVCMIGLVTLLVISMLLLSFCLLYTSPSPRDATLSRMPSSA